MAGDAENGAPRAWQPVRTATFPGAPAVPGAPQPLGRRVDGTAGTLRTTTNGGASVPQPSWTVGGAGAAPRRPAPTITLNPSRDRLAASSAPAPPKPAKRRCMLVLLRRNLDRAGGSLGGSLVADLSAVPDVDRPHHCCVADDMHAPSHPAAHDPDGPDGVDETVRAIVAVGGTVADAAATMSRRAAEARARDELFADECVVSLHCPLSSARMTVPGRGEACKHAECFDLHTFLRCALRATRASQRTQCADPDKYPECHPHHNPKKPLGRCDFCKHWRCPICRTPTTIGALRFDPFTDDILRNNPGVRRVKVTQSKGTYAPLVDMEERGEDDDDDEEGGDDDAFAIRPASNGKGKADGDGNGKVDGDAARDVSGPEVIELSDDSDEESDAKPASGTAGVGSRAGSGDGDGPVDPRGARRRRLTEESQEEVWRPTKETMSPPPRVGPVGSAAAPPVRDPPYFRRDLFPLANDKVEKLFGKLRGSKSGAFCMYAASRGTPESGVMDDLEKTLRDMYAMTKKLDHKDGDLLSSVIIAHKTGVCFQNFKRLVKDEQLEASPLGDRLRVALTLMSHSREHWKAVIRKTEIPPPMKEPSPERTAASATSKKGKAAAAASSSKKRTSAEGASSPRTTKKAKKPAASKTAAKKSKTGEGSGEGSGETGPAKSAQAKSKAKAKASAAGGSGGSKTPKAKPASEKKKTNAPAPETSEPKKQSECAARGHGHCRWDRKTPLVPHPFDALSSVLICQGCHAFYFQEPFTQDESGGFEHCRMCADGSSTLFCCDNCPQVFCKPCIQNLAGRTYLKNVEYEWDQWWCFCCDTSTINLDA